MFLTRWCPTCKGWTEQLFYKGWNCRVCGEEASTYNPVPREVVVSKGPVVYRRWNSNRREMEDWWPGKCCTRNYFHNDHICGNPPHKWESTVPITLPAIGQTSAASPAERPSSCPKCNAIVDTIYAATRCSDKWHTRGTIAVGSYNPHPKPTTSTTYRPDYPFDKVDRKKWPTTWWALFMMYFSGSWFQDCKYTLESYSITKSGAGEGARGVQTETIVSYDQAY